MITNNCKTIISYKLTWKEAIEKFELHDGNIQALYIRTIILLYDYKTAFSLLYPDESL